MTLTTSVISGRLPFPDDAVPANAYLRFTLSGVDTEGADVLHPADRVVTLVSGEIPPGFDLWRNTEGTNLTHYSVTLVVVSSDNNGAVTSERSFPLGVIQVGDTATYDLADLLVAPVNSLSVEAYIAQIVAAASTASTARDQAVAAAATVHRWEDNFADLSALVAADVAVGAYVRTPDGLYQRVVSGGHITTSPGGLSLNVIPKDGEILDRAFGVDGAGDDTSALAAAWAAMVSTGATLIVTQSCTLSGPIGSDVTHASASVKLRVVGNPVWTVDAAAPTFSFLARTESTAAGDCIITGGVLTIQGNNRVGSGLYYRHYSASQGGRVNITARIIGRNFTENNPAVTTENGGIICIGDFASAYIFGADIENVTRTNPSGGACNGAAVSGCSGTIVFEKCRFARVQTGPATGDADGCKAYNKEVGGRRIGSVRIIDCEFVDNQGRHIKTQSEDVIVINPTFKRQMIVPIANSVDCDLQECGGVLINPRFEYRKNGATSPLGASHSPVAGSFNLTGVSGRVHVLGGTYMSEVQTNRVLAINNLSGADKIDAVVDGLRCITLDPAIVALFTRSIIEVGNMDTLLARADDVNLIVRNIDGPLGCVPIGYTGYTTGGAPETYLYCEATNIRNTGPETTQRPFHNLSGNPVVQYKGFLIRHNSNIQASFIGATLTFDFQKLVPGCVFYSDIGGNTVTLAPPWGASGLALIEVIDGNSHVASRPTDRAVRVTKDGVGTIWMTHRGGSTWQTNAA